MGYSVEHGRYGIALSKHGSGGTAPFRCPKAKYDLITEAINDAPESFKLNRIYVEVQGRSGEEVPDYRVRVAVLFFTHFGAVKHSRARFTQDGEKSFRRTAKEAWDNLQHRTVAGQVPA